MLHRLRLFAAWAAIGLFGTLLLVTAGARVAGARPLTILTGSMEPVLVPGDVIVDRMVSPATLRPGQIVTFPDAARNGELVTHRVRLVRRVGRDVAVVTRGDANTGNEHWKVPVDGTVGVVAYRIPKLGLLSAWARSRTGLVLFLVLPATALLLLELRAVWRPRPGAPGPVEPVGDPVA